MVFLSLNLRKKLYFFSRFLILLFASLRMKFTNKLSLESLLFSLAKQLEEAEPWIEAIKEMRSNLGE